MKRGVSEKERNLHDYLVSHSVRNTPELEGLQQATLQHSEQAMLSPPDSIAILQLMIKLVRAKKIVEIGVFTGYTSLGMALALPADGKLYSLDLEEDYVNVGRPYWKKAGVADKIDVRLGLAADSLEKLLEELGEGSVDLGFMDADKSNYDTYYEYLMRLVRPGGVIIVDNVLWGGSVVDDRNQSSETVAIRKLNQKILKDPRVQPAMLKNSDGITVAYKL